MSDLVGIPEDRFSHNEAHIIVLLKDPGSGDAFKDDADCQEFLKNDEVMSRINNTLKPNEVKSRSVLT